jgi:hypothetical protein
MPVVKFFCRLEFEKIIYSVPFCLGQNDKIDDERIKKYAETG